MKYLEQQSNFVHILLNSWISSMSEFKNYRAELFKAALFTSPLIALIGSTPVYLFLNANPENSAPFIDYDFFQRALLILVVAVWIYIHWMVNIWLLKKMESPNGLFGSKKLWLRYGLSFGVILVQVTIRLIVFLFYKDVNLFFYIYPVISMVAANFFILLLINLIITRSEKATLQLEKANLEINQLKTQQEQLKQQIHPHFLFNSLGTLQILIDKDQKMATDYTATLANYLRSSLSLAQNDVVSIKEEVTFLTNYIELQKMRFGEAIQYEINIPDDLLTTTKLPVFSLQLLAENAIKHNTFSAAKPLKIVIQYVENGFVTVENNLSPKFHATAKSGIGLQNLKKRFAHFTETVPTIAQTDCSFQVKLKLLGI
ncbi:MAG: histidine kinase [Bacteroidota bacterium]